MRITEALKKFYHNTYSGKSEPSRLLSTIMGVYSKILGVCRSAVNFLNIITPKIPKSFMTGLRFAKAPSVVLAPFTIKNIIIQSKKVVRSESSIRKRIMAMLKTISQFASLGGAAATVSELVVLAKAAGSHILCWLPFFGYFSIATSAVGIGFAGRATFRTGVIVNLLKVGMQKLSQEQNEEKKREIVKTLVKELQELGPRKIGKYLKIRGAPSDADKLKAGIPLTKISIDKNVKLTSEERERVENDKSILSVKMRALIAKIDDPNEKNSISEAEQFFAVLKKRSARITTYNTLQTVALIVGVASTILTVFTPFLPVGLALAGVAAISGLGLWMTEYFFIKDNPFDPDNKSRACKISESIKNNATIFAAQFRSNSTKGTARSPAAA